MMLERTAIYTRSRSLSALRARPRNFHAWSGAALSRYFHKNDAPEPQPAASRGQKIFDRCSKKEMDERREKLQELLQQVDAERLNREDKKTG